MPSAGDVFNAVADERMARELAEERRIAQSTNAMPGTKKVSLEDLFSQIQAGEMKTLNIIVKADVQGSADLINSDPSHLLSSSYTPDVSEIQGTQYHMMFDSAALPHLEEMLQDLRDNGFNVYIGSAYRSYSYQKQLFDGMAYSLAVNMGIEGKEIWLLPEYQKAVEKARTITMEPGASEHQLGLAVDIYDRHYNSPLVYENMNQKFYTYLDSICAKYGFIKRYPTRKLLLTGWDEPWHYRYVGVEAATFIMEQGICYEEFYKHYVPDFQY